MASAERGDAEIDSGQLTDQQFEGVMKEIAPLSIVRQIIEYREKLRNDRPQGINQSPRPFIERFYNKVFGWVEGFRHRSRFPTT